MEKNIFKSGSADVKPLVKPKEKEERLVYWLICGPIYMLYTSSSSSGKKRKISALEEIKLVRNHC